MSYGNQLCRIDTEVDGIGDWLWPQNNDHDAGSFEGPRLDWDVRGNREAYLKYLKKKNLVVQAGGNCGMYPRLLAKYFTHVYTFEPDPMNFYCLVNNCQQDNIVKIMGALGDKNQLVQVVRNSMTNVGGHTIKEGDGTDGANQYIPMFAVDSLIYLHVIYCCLIVRVMSPKSYGVH